MTSPTHYSITSDGGCLGNGTASPYAYGSYLLETRDGQTYQSNKIAFVDYSTNNQAEYLAIIAALKDLIGRIEQAGRDPAHFSVLIHTDSALVSNQLRGEWKVKNPILADLHHQAQALMEHFEQATISKVDRVVVLEALGH